MSAFQQIAWPTQEQRVAMSLDMIRQLFKVKKHIVLHEDWCTVGVEFDGRLKKKLSSKHFQAVYHDIFEDLEEGRFTCIHETFIDLVGSPCTLIQFKDKVYIAI